MRRHQSIWPFANLISVFILLTSTGHTQTSDAPGNDLPRPYVTTRDWGAPPQGAPWAAVTAIEPAPDGGLARIVHGGGGERTRILCGFLGTSTANPPIASVLPSALTVIDPTASQIPLS